MDQPIQTYTPKDILTKFGDYIIKLLIIITMGRFATFSVSWNIYIYIYILNPHIQAPYKAKYHLQRNVSLFYAVDSAKQCIKRGFYHNIMIPTRHPWDMFMCWLCAELAITLRWRHNDHDSVSNHQPNGCLLNRLFRHRSKETSKFRVIGLCVGNSPGPVNSPHKGPVTRKMFPFDDVIMTRTFV